MPETTVATVVVEGEKGYAQRLRSGQHSWVSDEPPSRGGTDTGPNPTALLLSALGACTAITLRMYAERKKWELGPIRVMVSLHHRDEERQRIERELSFGANLSPEQRSKLAEIAGKTPVTKLVRAGADIETRITASSAG